MGFPGADWVPWPEAQRPERPPPGSGRDPIRRRRPSGEPAPLPKRPLAGSGKVWIAIAALLAGVFALLSARSEFFVTRGEWWNDLDAWFTDKFLAVRRGALTSLARGVDWISADWFVSALRWLTIGALVVFKRWRHLMVFVLVVLATETVVVGLANGLARPRPDGVEILTDWSGFAAPSLAVAAVAVTLVAMVYSLTVPGLARRQTLLGLSALLAVLGLARVYLAVDRVTDVASAIIIAVTIPLVAYRLATPDAVYPVLYARGKTAHLDLSGARRTAILTALRDQLGIEASGLEPFGLEGSGGSTPMKIDLAVRGSVFAKLYARNHLRSDRWYKLGRTVLYGALEDEAPFRTVRRLAEHEDHVMRLMEAAGVPCPAPLGIAATRRVWLGCERRVRPWLMTVIES